MSGDYVEVERAVISADVSSMPSRKALIEVSGGDFDVSARHVSYGNNYLFYIGSTQYNQTAHLNADKYTIFLPFRIKGFQVASFKVHAGTCTQNVSKLFVLN